MRILNFILFFALFFGIYGAVNYYVILRGWQSLPPLQGIKSVYLVFSIFLALAFIIGRILENFYLSVFTDVIVWMGAFWLAALLYFFLFVVLIDLLRLSNALVLWFPAIIRENYILAKQIAAASVLFSVFLILLFGHLNARNPRIKTLKLDINKNANGLTHLKIAAASDIHLGTNVGRKRFCDMVEKINNLQPDIVLFPGDIVDEDLKPVIRQNLGDALMRIKSKYGIFAVTGNHEYIGGVDQAVKYLSDHNVQMLRDSCILIDGKFYVAGREDISINRFRSRQRKAIPEILAGIDQDLPVILLDHQPFKLEQASNSGVDLQLSGHTHHGQMWPFNFITNLVYELSWGYLKKGNTHFYVSAGAGTWGPPVRTGNSPEILEIILTFQN